MGFQKVRLKDIAGAAQVSTATVSMALRNSPRIGVDTKKRIRKIASDLGYRMDPQISRLMHYLRTNKSPIFSGVIGFLNAYENSGKSKLTVFTNELFKGAEEFSNSQGYRLENLWLYEKGMTDKRMNDILNSRNIRALILPPHPTNHVHLHMDWKSLAVVSHALTIKEPDVHSVCSHHFYAARLAYLRLYELGYRRIGFAIHPNHNDRTEHMWTGGYMSRSREASPSDQIPEYVGPSSKAFISWFKQYKPDALIISKMDFWKILKDHGIQAPEDYSYACLSLSRYNPSGNGNQQYVPVEYLDANYPGDRIQSGEIAGVLQKHSEMGKIGASLVIGILQQNSLGLPESSHNILVKGDWVDGASAPGK